MTLMKVIASSVHPMKMKLLIKRNTRTLFQLFPSKHLKDQLDNSDDDSDDDGYDDEDDGDYYDDDSYDEDIDTEEEEEMIREAMNGMNFNIVFAIGQGDSDNDSDDEDDSDGDDGDDEKSDDDSTPKKKRKTKKPRIYERIAGDNESTTDEETVTTNQGLRNKRLRVLLLVNHLVLR